MLSKNRDEKSTKRFFDKAIGCNTKPEKITIDKSGANNAALQSINNRSPKQAKIEIQQIKYSNNIIEQDHRFIKRNVKPMMGFKAFYSVSATLIGQVELGTVWDDWHISMTAPSSRTAPGYDNAQIGVPKRVKETSDAPGEFSEFFIAMLEYEKTCSTPRSTLFAVGVVNDAMVDSMTEIPPTGGKLT